MKKNYFLFDEPPLIILPELAVKIGLNEAIVLQQLHYWLIKSTNIRDDKKWIYNSIREWQEQFPFWSVDTIRRALNRLINSGIVIKGEYSKTSFDKTTWYTINYDVLEEKLGKGSAKSIYAKCINGCMQNAQMDVCKMHKPIPENNINIPENNINNNNINNKEEEEEICYYNDIYDKTLSPPPPQSNISFSRVLEFYKLYAPTLYSKEYGAGINDDLSNARAFDMAYNDEGMTIDDLIAALKKAESSTWLREEAKNITLKWIIEKRRLIINGKYDDKSKEKKISNYSVTREL